MLAGACPTLFGEDVPPEHQARIDRYTRELADAIERVGLGALAARAPSRIEWGIGTAGFARNRRTEGGPVHRDLPVLRVSGVDGAAKAILAGYVVLEDAAWQSADGKVRMV